MDYSASMTTRYVAYAPLDVRAAFLRKVYGLFLASLLVTAGVGCITYQPAVAPNILPLWLPLCIGGLIVILVLRFTRQIPGLNAALFFLYASIQGALLGAIMSLLNQNPVYAGIPQQAVTLTVTVFAGLTLYVMQTRKDFAFLGGLLFAGIIALIVAGIFLLFFHVELLYTVYCVAGVLIFCGYILYDTSNIMQRLGPNDAMIGAIELYIDFIGLLWFILRLLSRMRD